MLQADFPMKASPTSNPGLVKTVLEPTSPGADHNHGIQAKSSRLSDDVKMGPHDG